jgi:transcriptional regulator with XRE-family HTH domain
MPAKRRSAKKSPHPVDVHVGARVRVRRQMLGITQDKLGEELGLTFQQVQKYEKGANRIGASRVFEIARALDVPVQYFFDGLNGAEPSGLSEEEAEFMRVMHSPEGLEICRSFAEIKDPRVKKRVLDLVRTLAAGERAAPGKA